MALLHIEHTGINGWLSTMAQSWYCLPASVAAGFYHQVNIFERYPKYR
jgi:hypothetical protein